LKPLQDYHRLIARIDRASRRIQEVYPDQITCQKGCAGNCCRIHLSIFPIEAISLSGALQKLPRKMVDHIRDKARQATGSSPCPLLEEGACLMYASRLVICRTHGLPMRTDYRGNRFIGFCQKNFRDLNPIPDDAIIDLDDLNHSLAAVNRLFVEAFSDRIQLNSRFYIGEALLLNPNLFADEETRLASLLNS
jgi:Fe-S-cluster containining protein